MKYHTVMLNALLFSVFLLPALPALSQNSGRNPQGNVVTVASELEAFHNVSQLPAYREQTVVEQVSSYDRTGGNDDGFSGRYSFVRRLADSSLVLLDVTGPGVVNRIWTPTPTTDSLDFYIDDTTRPAFTISYIDLFSGKVFPFVAPLCNNQLGGYYCYLPIPYQQRCRIVYRGKQTQFYQVGYRTFPQGTRVESFSTRLNTAAQEQLKKITTLWQQQNKSVNDFVPDRTAVQTFRKTFQLQPGQQQTVAQIEKGGRIVGIEMEPAGAFEGIHKNLDLKITWDHEQHPAVYCPVADFFGYAFGKTSMESLLLGSRGNTNYCYFPMPFNRSAKIELVYRKGTAPSEPVTISTRIYYLPQPGNTEKEGKFYTHWKHQPSVPLGQPHVFLNVPGKGHYVATVLQARGLDPGMTGFFEGDDSTVVDGRLTMHGTGSEDYFNGGWYAMMDRWDGPLSLPLSGALDYTLPLSRTGGYRLFLTDKISFAKSIHHSIEHGGERNDAPGVYTSVAYYYSNSPAPAATSPTAALTTVTMPDTMTIYPQLLTMNTTSEVGIRRVWAYHTGGESIIFTATGESGVRIHLENVPDGSYKILLDYVRFPQGASFSVWQRQTPLTGWMESYGSDTNRIEKQHVADITLTPLNHTLTLRFKSNAERNQFFLNRVILVSMKNEELKIKN